jgi:drug/metabolite transporter (DMT)-like permease
MLLAVAVVWGAAFPAVQYALRAGLSTEAFMTLRFAVGAAGLGVLVMASRLEIRRADVWDGARLGLLVTAIYWLQTDGLRFTTSSRSGFITGLYVIFTPMVGSLVGHRLSRRQAASAGLAVAGLYGLVGLHGDGFNRGDVETLLCAILSGVQMVWTAHLARRNHPMVLALLQAVVIGCCVATMLAWRGHPWLELTPALQPGVLLSILFCGLLATAFCFWAQAHTQARVPPTEAAVFFALEPLFATLISVGGWVPGIQEHLGLGQWGGVALMLVAALLATS